MWSYSRSIINLSIWPIEFFYRLNAKLHCHSHDLDTVSCNSLLFCSSTRLSQFLSRLLCKLNADIQSTALLGHIAHTLCKDADMWATNHWVTNVWVLWSSIFIINVIIINISSRLYLTNQWLPCHGFWGSVHVDPIG